MTTRRCQLISVALAAVVGAGCTVQTDTPRPGTQGQTAEQPAGTAPAGAPGAGGPGAGGPVAGDSAARDSLVDPSQVPPERRPRADMRLEVDLGARRVTVYRGQAQAATYPVAVGSAEWPTQTGEWAVSQVVWNPEWVPPDESWAEQRERKAPGAPDNPLGRAQLIYDPPRTIHGTNEPNSIGRAVSHGSIRMRNADITALARDVMEVAGVGKDSAWYQQVRERRTEKQVVDLPRVVPIRVF